MAFIKKMRTRIWNEITKLKHDIEYLRVYSRLQGNLARWINIMILIFSSTGILGWSIWENPDLAGIACGLTVAMTLVKMISPFFILSDKETKKLDKYYVQLVNLFDLLEKFWYEFEDNRIKDSQITTEFYKFVQKGTDIHDRFSDLNIMHIKPLIKKSDTNTRNYFKNIFNI